MPMTLRLCLIVSRYLCLSKKIVHPVVHPGTDNTFSTLNASKDTHRARSQAHLQSAHQKIHEDNSKDKPAGNTLSQRRLAIDVSH